MKQKDPNAVGFLEEKPGVKSSMRAMSLLVYFLLCGIDFWILKWGWYATHAWDQMFAVVFIAINLVFLIAMFYPKYLQKIIELGFSKLKDGKDALAPLAPKDVTLPGPVKEG